MDEESLTATPIADSPTTLKNAETSHRLRPPKNDLLKTRRARRLRWEKLDGVTWKLIEPGKNTDVPKSNGQWPGFRTTFPLAWVMNIGWPAATGDAWLGRCRDKRGDWCLGPTTFDDARAQTKNYVLGLPVEGSADEWFLTNPIRELNEIQAALSRRRAA
jgi:hypothetical protein